MNTPIDQARKLENVRYDIRGRILDKTEELEDQGHTILRLNVGNPAPFGFEAPDEIMMAMIRNLPTAQGYCDSRGLYSARTAVVQYHQTRGITDVTVDEIYLGNGVSELITLTMQALCNPEDEILIPAPDYPLWTASVSLAGGTPVHYLTDESQGWAPDFDDLEARITPRTRGIVVINPNNPTGAVYSTEVLQRFVDLARKHDLMLFADEIYEKIVYDGRSMTNLATMTGRDVLCLTYSGLSKAYRVCGFRAGWLAITGPLERASSFIEGIKLLANMRMCANVPAQHAIQTALGGRQSIEDLLLPQGRLTAQRDLAHTTLNSIDGISCQQADGALYLFPKLDVDKFGIVDDERFVLDLLESEKILVSHGRAFNWIEPDHFRLVTLPNTDDLSTALERLGNFLSSYSQ
ncbi:MULTISPECIES: pyridoxal phosphate-dependent aminotransferase [Rhodococcus]|uniref:pyridoxal phosphate-dependent aminotransferase n=1 Tax=Rhodococcus TaxID=1827 RepID=UPI0006BA5AEA|nr:MULTISPECIES: pyridoxal phosphate-dependent aminotransferase [Rhodococcus]AUS30566.1 pyridoxal phosphate-dependent aminotransferase [Rhodococcus qingshengii]KPH18116.1 aminotransferase [Rhodococcus sp. ADH]MCC4302957.1 pyridoxal phosphate-dependent aminotransferase [Rhodococcus sp. 3-2]MDI9943779.1 pyridoxal phosphate-dependent aminotransferase [Rhodococcus sp. IEGM 1302]OMQ35200.1 aminotransferase [Rhodococcus sp. D-1]